MTTCPKGCGTDGFANPGALAAHLIDAHDMAGLAALAKAREVAGLVRASRPPIPIPPKEGSHAMAKNSDRTGECRECGRLRHGKNCSQHFLARKDKGRQTMQEPRAAAKRKPITRKHPLPPKKAAAASNNGLLSELDALRSTAAALEPLGPIERMHVLACVCKLLAIETSELVA
jgi:hypothetical protein